MGNFPSAPFHMLEKLQGIPLCINQKTQGRKGENFHRNNLEGERLDLISFHKVSQFC